MYRSVENDRWERGELGQALDPEILSDLVETRKSAVGQVSEPQLSRRVTVNLSSSWSVHRAATGYL